LYFIQYNKDALFPKNNKNNSHNIVTSQCVSRYMHMWDVTSVVEDLLKLRYYFTDRMPFLTSNQRYNFKIWRPAGSWTQDHWANCPMLYRLSNIAFDIVILLGLPKTKAWQCDNVIRRSFWKALKIIVMAKNLNSNFYLVIN
jgi:hypothetical protein